MFLFPHIFQFGNGDLRCFPPPPYATQGGNCNSLHKVVLYSSPFGLRKSRQYILGGKVVSVITYIN